MTRKWGGREDEREARCGCCILRSTLHITRVSEEIATMKIAVLGWGSLIWNLGVLKIAGDWMAGGPILPIEFSRISKNGRLTLAVDENDGTDVVTRYAFSAVPELAAAIDNLKEREGAPNRNRIGFVDILHGSVGDCTAKQHSEVCQRIHNWAVRRQLDAVIWTALGPNFFEKRREAFSVDAALRYLSSLDEPTKSMALEYIYKAPSEVKTPLRSAVELGFSSPAA
jgi:hypothetical protein